MPIKNTESTLASIYKQIDNHALVLPNFQRGFVWDRRRQQRFLASFLVGLPIGSLLLLQGHKDDFSKRRLCYPKPIKEAKEDCVYILDGQQRLSSLRVIFYDVFAEENRWDTAFKNLYGQLRTRWFLRVVPEAKEEDIFNYYTLDPDYTLDKYTDGEIQDFVEFRVVHKTKTSATHHPNFKPKAPGGKSGSISKLKLQNAQADAFAQEGLVPLWSIHEKKSGIHRRTLEKIANHRVSKLQLDAEENGHSLDFYEKVFAPLQRSREEIKEKLSRENDKDPKVALTTEWASLSSTWVSNLSQELENVLSQNIPIISMDRGEVERAVAVFEAINRGGSPLSVYDLIVAKSAYAKHEENLSVKILSQVNTEIQINKDLSTSFLDRQPPKRSTEKAKWLPATMGIIEGNEPTNQYKDWFVNTLSLIVYTKEKNEAIHTQHIKKDKHLGLSAQEVNKFSKRAVTAISRALAFLQFRCGITSANAISYKLMVLVLAYFLDRNSVWTKRQKLDRLEFWYWTSLLGGSYYTRQNEQCIEDIRLLEDFLETGEGRIRDRRKSLLNYPDYATKEILLRQDDATDSEQKSVQLGILQFILSRLPNDLDTSQHQRDLLPWEIASGDVEIEFHHVVPLANVSKVGDTASKIRGDQKNPLNSVINLTPITKEANRRLNDKPPAQYLKALENAAKAHHYLPEISYFKDALASEDYKKVLEQRLSLLKNGIENHLSTLV